MPYVLAVYYVTGLKKNLHPETAVRTGWSSIHNAGAFQHTTKSSRRHISSDTFKDKNVGDIEDICTERVHVVATSSRNNANKIEKTVGRGDGW